MAIESLTKHTVTLPPITTQSVHKTVKEIPKGVQMVQAPAYWERGLYGKGVTIAVIDTGCDSNHPDIKDRIIGGRNFTDDNNGHTDNFNDYDGHGTHVAGTIAATKNERGVVGVAPEASLLILKAVKGTERGGGQISWLTSAIEYAIKQKVDIISMSVGTETKDEALHEAIRQAVGQNILVVCAAGNSGTELLEYPAAFNESISIGVVDFNTNSSSIQTTNNEVDLVAPGVDILSAYPLSLVEDSNNPYMKLTGTSMSAPHVAGALALLINHCRTQFGRKLTEVELYAQLVKQTIPLGREKCYEGNGLLYLTASEYLQDYLKQHPIDLEQYI